MTSLTFLLGVLVLAINVKIGEAYHRRYGLPANATYCGSNNQCCVGWTQETICTHRILDTICYCDDYCKNSDYPYDDCCPDYEEVCKLEIPEPAPQALQKKFCIYSGKKYDLFKKRRENCKICQCQIDPITEETYWSNCTETCLISDSVVKRVNYDHDGWRAFNYTQFYGKTLDKGITYKLGTFPLRDHDWYLVSRDSRVPPRKQLPSSFDARKKWGYDISPIIDQGWCGSDWAVSLAAIVSDRLAIKSGMKVRLSPQILLSCNKQENCSCKGGHLYAAWEFIAEKGLVEEDCFPYKAAETDCPFLNDACKQGLQLNYTVSKPSRLQTEEDIMHDIMTSGPVHAIMAVYQDFFHYREGIYRRTKHGNYRKRGFHSVRIIGWGEDGGVKYWTVANSWGKDWGENGYFRIMRGAETASIEYFVTTVDINVNRNS